MSLFLQRTFDSLANGSAYAALAVAISMVFRSTGILNLAQGQLAMFSTYIALVLATGPSPYMKFSANTDLIGAAWPVWAAKKAVDHLSSSSTQSSAGLSAEATGSIPR